MRLKKLYLFLRVLMVTILLGSFSCLPPGDNTDPHSPTTVDVKQTVESLDTVSRSAAEQLTGNQEILTILYNEIGKRFDGDTDVLYDSIKDIVLSNGRTIHEVLCAMGGADGSAGLKVKLEELSTKINLQIYMPNYANWDGKIAPWVGFVPMDKDESYNEITAYDAQGNPHTVNDTNYKTVPLLIFGPNERVSILAKASLASVQNIGETHNFGDQEVLYGICIYDTHEPFYKGDPEICVKAEGTDGNLYSQLANVNDKDKWYSFETGLDFFLWKSNYGNSVKVHVWELECDRYHAVWPTSHPYPHCYTNGHTHTAANSYAHFTAYGNANCTPHLYFNCSIYG